MFFAEFRIQNVYLMLCVNFHVRDFKMAPTKRRTFCKQFKLKFTNWFFENGKNINQRKVSVSSVDGLTPKQ